MKATKKIVGAACALVAAVALSAGSTFAWFLSSSSVDAKGMTVQATVPTSLYIESKYHSDYTEVGKRSITMTAAGTDMYPAVITSAALTNTFTDLEGASTGAGTPLTGGAVYASNAKTFSENPTGNDKGTASAYETIATGTASATSLNWVEESTGAAEGITDGGYTGKRETYVISEDMTLANLGSQIGTVQATVDVTWTEEDALSYKFIRTGLVVKTTAGYSLFSLANESGDKVDYGAAEESQKITFTYDDLIKDFAPNTVVTVSLLVWFDGEDDDCYVSNASIKDTFTINVTFVADPETV